MREIVVGEPPEYRFKYVGLKRRPVLQVASKERVVVNIFGDTRLKTRWRDATPKEAERLLFEREEQ